MQNPILHSIAAAHAKHVELLRRWCEINSGTYNLAGLAKMQAELIDAFSPLGGELSLIDLPPAETIDSRGNVVAQPLGRAISIIQRPDAPLRVLLNIHYDTVYSADDRFQHVEQIDDDTLRGPGVADAKGGIIVLLMALTAIENSPLANRIGWEVLLNPDEEIGSPGSAHLFIDAAKRNHVGLLFEPAFPDGALVDARKGSGTFTAIVRGRAAHAGRDFAAGRSAILALANLIMRLQPPSESPGVIINCGKIEGGGATNIVPDLAIARFNARADSVDDQRIIERLFGAAIQEVGRRDGISITLRGGFNSPPKPFDDPSRSLMNRLIDAGNKLGLSLIHRPSGGASDGSKLAAAGLAVVDSLGPVGGDLHSPREWIQISSLTQRAQLVALLLADLAADAIP